MLPLALPSDKTHINAKASIPKPPQLTQMALANRLASLNTHIRERPAIALATVAGASLIPILPYAVKSYRQWLSLGPGGVPYNILGWMAQGALQLVAYWDTIDLSPFSRPSITLKYEPHGRSSFLEPGPPLPTRAGPRPTVPGFVAPQRQTTQTGAADLPARMEAHLHAVAGANPSALTMQPSKLEGGHTRALWLADEARCPAFAARLHGELVHVHGEGSSHATLSLADAEEAVRQGWGERHRLSGVAGMPWGYLLLYAPRDDVEFEVWKRLVHAGVQFVCGGGPVIEKP